MFFRVTRAGKYQYLQIARSHRDGNTVRQQTLLSLGRLDVLQASGQLDALLRSGLRLSQRLAVVDAHAAGQTEPVAVRRIGPDLVFSRLWEQTSIQQCLLNELEGRRYEFSVERAVYLTVLHRLFASGSDSAGGNNIGFQAPKSWSCIICIEPWLFWEIRWMKKKTRS